jgi:hypothetical protein
LSRSLAVPDLVVRRQNWSSSIGYQILGVDRCRGFRGASLNFGTLIQGAAYVRSADEEVYFHDSKLEGEYVFAVPVFRMRDGVIQNQRWLLNPGP